MSVPKRARIGRSAHARIEGWVRRRETRGPPADLQRVWQGQRVVEGRHAPPRAHGVRPYDVRGGHSVSDGQATWPKFSTRRTVRLPEHNYAGHAMYFVTICTYDRAPLFGQVCDGAMVLSRAGQIVDEEWRKTARMRPEIVTDDWVIMPNHVHAIVLFLGTDGDASAPLPRSRRSLGTMLAGFKSAVTARIRAELGPPDAIIWQRNYYEHIVRDTSALDRIRRYIAENPARWHLDRENEARTSDDPFDMWLGSIS